MHKTHQLFRNGNAQKSYQEIDNQTVHLSQIYFNVLSQLKQFGIFAKAFIEKNDKE